MLWGCGDFGVHESCGIKQMKEKINNDFGKSNTWIVWLCEHCVRMCARCVSCAMFVFTMVRVNMNLLSINPITVYGAYGNIFPSRFVHDWNRLITAVSITKTFKSHSMRKKTKQYANAKHSHIYLYSLRPNVCLPLPNCELLRVSSSFFFLLSLYNIASTPLICAQAQKMCGRLPKCSLEFSSTHCTNRSEFTVIIPSDLHKMNFIELFIWNKMLLNARWLCKHFVFPLSSLSLALSPIDKLITVVPPNNKHQHKVFNFFATKWENENAREREKKMCARKRRSAALHVSISVIEFRSKDLFVTTHSGGQSERKKNIHKKIRINRNSVRKCVTLTDDVPSLSPEWKNSLGWRETKKAWRREKGRSTSNTIWIFSFHPQSCAKG